MYLSITMYANKQIEASDTEVANAGYLHVFDRGSRGPSTVTLMAFV